MNQDCMAVRVRIQESLDNRRAISPRIRRHLADCSECEAFMDSWETLLHELKGALDEEVGRLAPPDYSLLQQKAKTGEGQGRTTNDDRGGILHRPLLWAAAAVFIVIVGLSGYSGFSRYRLHSTIRENNRLFVESLFERSIFDTGEQTDFYAWNGINNDWFEETEFSRYLLDQINGSQ